MAFQVSRSARWYRERVGLEPTRRGPVPTLSPGLNRVHSAPVSPPLPEPAAILATTGHSPDSGPTTIWPHGADGESPQ